MTLRNVWSLQKQESTVVDTLKKVLKNDYEVFLPSNSHLQDIDLAIINLKNHKTKTVQIISSPSYEHRGDYYTWLSIKKDIICHQVYSVDFFIFAINIPKFLKYEKMLQTYIVISASDLKKIVKNKNADANDKYHFSIWIDIDNKYAIDYRNKNGASADLSKYLNNFDVLK